MKKFEDVDKLVDYLTWDYSADMDFLAASNSSPLVKLEKEILNFRHLLCEHKITCKHSASVMMHLVSEINRWSENLSRQRGLLLDQGLTDEDGFATVRDRLTSQNKEKKDN